MPKFTTGPWHEDQSNTFGPPFVLDENSKPVAAMCVRDEGREAVYGNARLIAAAPELLTIAIDYIEMCEDTFIDPEDMSPESVLLYKLAKQAVAKAVQS